MFDFLSKKIPYLYNDMSIEFINWLEIYTSNNYLLTDSGSYLFKGSFLHIIDFFLKNILTHLFYPLATYNLLVILNIFIIIIVTSVLLSRINRNITLSLLFSLTLIFQPYFMYRVISGTSDLLYIFVFPIVFFLLYKKSSPIVLAFFSIAVFFLNSYYGMFTILLVFFWGISATFLSGKFVANLKYYLSYLLLITTFVLLLFGNLVFNNTSLSKNYVKESVNGTPIVFRSINDYYNFSFRPWYFFIPPERSVYFGNFSDKALEFFANTGYYLADDYSAEEMAGSYMGWHLLFGGLVALFILIIKKFRKKEYVLFSEVYKNQKLIWQLIIVSVLILAISFPPSFVIKGIEIYTPSYLLYYIAPIFRVLTRWAIVLFLNLLIINFILFSSIYMNLKSHLAKWLLLGTFMLVNYFVFAIRLPVIDLNNPPSEIAFLDTLNEREVFAVYPSGDFYSIFWILKHKLVLANPVGAGTVTEDYDPVKFSENLVTQEGLNNFIYEDGKVLVLYKDRVSKNHFKEIGELNSSINGIDDLIDFFKNNFGNTVYSDNNAVIFEHSDKL